MTKVEMTRSLDMAEVGRIWGEGDVGIAVYTRLLSQSDWLKQFAVVTTSTVLIALGWTVNRGTPWQ